MACCASATFERSLRPARHTWPRCRRDHATRGREVPLLQSGRLPMYRPTVSPRSSSSWGPVAAALALVAAVTLVPTRNGAGDELSVWCLTCGDFALADAVANVALFVPLGWALARTSLRLHRRLAVVLSTTIGVELLQHAVVRGRVASVADVITNTVGG